MGYQLSELVTNNQLIGLGVVTALTLCFQYLACKTKQATQQNYSPSACRNYQLFTTTLVAMLIALTSLKYDAKTTMILDEAWLYQKVYAQMEILTPAKIERFSDNRQRLSWWVALSQLQVGGAEVSLSPPAIIKLSWYLDPAETAQSFGWQDWPSVQQRWRTHLKLKANHYSMNLGSQGYETYLFAQGINATGYVVKSPQRVFEWQLVERLPLSLRSRAIQSMQQALQTSPLSGVYLALLLGERQQISDEQWQLFRQTGTTHLMAISGLHFAIIMALVWWLVKGLWWLGLYRYQRLDFVHWLALLSVLVATAYLLLSGAAVSTQRAWVMLLVVCLLLLFDRKFQSWTALAWALILVLLWSPRAVLFAGFWLSFLAVAVILASRPVWQHGSGIWQMIKLQWVLSLAMLPATLWFFDLYPLYSWAANLIAVPFVSFIGLPSLLLFALLHSLHEGIGLWWLSIVDMLWSGLVSYLQWLLSLSHPLLGWLPQSGVWILGVYGLMLLLLLTALRYRVMILLLSVSLVLGWRGVESIDQGAFRVTLLDVGQGQSLVIETARHAVVIDTGAKRGSYDAAEFVVLPYLNYRGWSRLQTLVVSHSDNDHAGAQETITQSLQVEQILAGQPQLPRELQCVAGQSWVLDDVTFEILSPLPSRLPRLSNDNDHSCVVRVYNSEFSVLVPGDLSAREEHYLIEYYGDALKSDLLIAGHHGSKYSTSAQWLEVVAPTKVWFSSGYGNGFGFPAPEVIARISGSTQIANTACEGALSLLSSSADLWNSYRASQQRWYHHRCLINKERVQ